MSETRNLFEGLEDVQEKETYESIKTKIDSLQNKWDPQYRLINMLDEPMQRAFELLENNYITGLEFKSKDKDEETVVIRYEKSHCGNNSYITKKLGDPGSLTRPLKTPIRVCDACVSGAPNCLPFLAGYLYYAKKNGFLEDVLKERELYQEKIPKESAGRRNNYKAEKSAYAIPWKSGNW